MSVTPFCVFVSSFEATLETDLSIVSSLIVLRNAMFLVLRLWNYFSELSSVWNDFSEVASLLNDLSAETALRNVSSAADALRDTPLSWPSTVERPAAGLGDSRAWQNWLMHSLMYIYVYMFIFLYVYMLRCLWIYMFIDLYVYMFIYL